MSDDEIVEKMAEAAALSDGYPSWNVVPDLMKSDYRRIVRAALSAVIPLIEERALRRAAEAVRNEFRSLQEGRQIDVRDIQFAVNVAILSLIPQEQKNEETGK